METNVEMCDMKDIIMHYLFASVITRKGNNQNQTGCLSHKEIGSFSLSTISVVKENWWSSDFVNMSSLIE